MLQCQCYSKAWYSKTFSSLYQFCRDKTNNNRTDPESFKFKSKLVDTVAPLTLIIQSL